MANLNISHHLGYFFWDYIKLTLVSRNNFSAFALYIVFKYILRIPLSARNTRLILALAIPIDAPTTVANEEQRGQCPVRIIQCCKILIKNHAHLFSANNFCNKNISIPLILLSLNNLVVDKFVLHHALVVHSCLYLISKNNPG